MIDNGRAEHAVGSDTTRKVDQIDNSAKAFTACGAAIWKRDGGATAPGQEVTRSNAPCDVRMVES